MLTEIELSEARQLFFENDSILSHHHERRGLRVVSIGGGTGLSTLLEGLKEYVQDFDALPASLDSLAAVVAVSDNGGSSGRLRDELNMLPPGDIRNCMVALSEDSSLLARLFRYRFPGDGALGGHSFGNLFLAALTEVTGDFGEAVRLSSEVLASKGRIFPATLTDVHLVAEFVDGTRVHGETNITGAGKPIKKLSLEPEQCEPLPDALAALHTADVITVGPGSLYTSLLPPLLVRQVATTIAASRAIKIFICNLMTQPGETDGYTARQHLEVVAQYVPDIHFDYVVVNSTPISPVQTERYRAEGAQQIGLSEHVEEYALGRAADLVRADLLDDGPKVRHHPHKLARVVVKYGALARAMRAYQPF